MTISYPLTAPTVRSPRNVRIGRISTVGLQMSPFTKEQTTYVHQGEMWKMDVSLPPMSRTLAEAWVGFLLALNGPEGTFLMGQPGYTTARGTWSANSPLVNGASQTGKSLAVDGLTASATVKAGDWLQLGSGSSTRLHKVSQDATANGSGQVTLDIWPRLRSSPSDNAAVTISSPKGIWRLARNDQDWDIDLALIYGLSFSAIEAL